MSNSTMRALRNEGEPTREIAFPAMVIVSMDMRYMRLEEGVLMRSLLMALAVARTVCGRSVL